MPGPLVLRSLLADDTFELRCAINESKRSELYLISIRVFKSRLDPMVYAQKWRSGLSYVFYYQLRSYENYS